MRLIYICGNTVWICCTKPERCTCFQLLRDETRFSCCSEKKYLF